MGNRNDNGKFHGLGNYGFWWCTTEPLATSPTTATWITITQKLTATISISRSVSLSVVWGIRLFGYLQSRFFFGIVLFDYFREAVDFFLENGYFRYFRIRVGKHANYIA